MGRTFYTIITAPRMRSFRVINPLQICRYVRLHSLNAHIVCDVMHKPSLDLLPKWRFELRVSKNRH
ncbi:hypothetical protein SCLCIDRAFT_1206799 [Scleroderma citrinum Foug A]|uniref:Uncharacterized protein n=1 Tax=Scleroderma citrinum Foug A TaxID=1036808 RepID=A0A0C3ES94_9AGAM|nr:hypothetical protein SCLCIDRAFT_1206799 [Scleroderma citrinum Foug A]